MWYFTDVTARPDFNDGKKRTIRSRGFDQTKFDAMPKTKFKMSGDGETVPDFIGEISLECLENGDEGTASDPFAPLDWAERDSGSVRLEYWEAGQWNQL